MAPLSCFTNEHRSPNNRSFKDLAKAIQTFIPTASLPLPDDLIDIIEAYIQKHDSKFGDSTTDKANEELLSIFNKDVIHTPARYAPFMAIVRRLRPMVAKQDRIFQWFDLLLPVLDHLGREKGLASECQGTLLDVMTADDDDGTRPAGAGAAIHLAEIWLEECESLRQDFDLGRTPKEKFLRETLVLYGKRCPQDFLALLDRFLVRKQYRTYILMLLAEFVKSQPPHLHLILRTSLFGNIINCLQRDTSTTVISLALTALTMILPHIPSSLVPHLPVLFNIYARLLFWERDLQAQQEIDPGEERRLSGQAPTWERCTYSADFDDTSIPHLINYFTILYGLYPINFMDYIRKPQRYLRHADVPGSEDIEVQPTEMRHASERFRQCHLLHENFYTLTIDSEKTDFGRWIKSEPSEVVADCVALRFAPEQPPLGPNVTNDAMSGALESTSEETDAESGASALLSRSVTLMRHSSQSSHQSLLEPSTARPSADSSDSPVLKKQISSSGSQTHLQDMLTSNKVIKSGLSQSLANDSVASLSLSHQDSLPERPNSQIQPTIQRVDSPMPAVEGTANDQITQLYRQILLLHVDLTFERFMKQQHLTHMGELRRRQVREAASEAETQNLIIANRHLKQRFEDAKKSELQVKKESERSRTLAKRWEADITAKLRNLREEQKKWSIEEKTLQSKLETARSEADKLVQLVCDAEVRELGLKQNMQLVEISAGELERLRKEVDRLTESERNWQAKETDQQAAIARSSDAESRAEILSLKLKAAETELRQMSASYESQVADLRAKLQDAIKGGSARRRDDAVTKLNSALAAARNQQQEQKKRMADLMKENTVLQGTILELKTKLPGRSRSHTRLHVFPPEADQSTDSESQMSGVPIRPRHRSRDTDPNSSTEAVSYATPPVEPIRSSSGSYFQRTESPSDAGTSPAARAASPTIADRYYGRGK